MSTLKNITFDETGIDKYISKITRNDHVYVFHDDSVTAIVSCLLFKLYFEKHGMLDKLHFVTTYSESDIKYNNGSFIFFLNVGLSIYSLIRASSRNKRVFIIDSTYSTNNVLADKLRNSKLPNKDNITLITSGTPSQNGICVKTAWMFNVKVNDNDYSEILLFRILDRCENTVTKDSRLVVRSLFSLQWTTEILDDLVVNSKLDEIVDPESTSFLDDGGYYENRYKFVFNQCKALVSAYDFNGLKMVTANLPRGCICDIFTIYDDLAKLFVTYEVLHDGHYRYEILTSNDNLNLLNTFALFNPHGHQSYVRFVTNKNVFNRTTKRNGFFSRLMNWLLK